ncbi:MAG: GGDEF domain-containing protein [Bdellovibrionales bacterium]|nr:GGDEF domain-containing protein [Bdellovibrionales bacterium]
MRFFKVKKFFRKNKTDNLKKDNQNDLKKNPEIDSRLNSTHMTELTEILKENTSILQKNQVHPTSLLLLKGPEDLVGVSWNLEESLISVGRSFRLNNITIPNPSLSKAHFQILKEKDNFYLVDMKSTNKTYLNDEEIEPYKKYPLKDNDYIRASSVIFKFLGEGNIEGISSKQILNKTLTDSLTGIGNRELLKRKGKDYFNLKVLSLIVFDVDKFKSINDGFGHTAGDYVLRMVAKNLLDVTRNDDLVIRYGGDEFCILSPEPLKVAYKVAERIRYKVSNMNLKFQNQSLQVELSIGVTEKNKSDKSWQDVYHRADQLSYEEKNLKKAKT